MAVVLRKQYSVPLGTLVESRLQSLKGSYFRLKTEEETDFLERIQKEGMSLREQLLFRERQLKQEEQRQYSDPDYTKNIREQIVSLKKQIGMENYRNAYLQSLEDIKLSKKSYADHISFLEGQLGEGVSSDLAQQIKEDLSEARVEQQNLDNAAYENFVKYANESKSVELIKEAIQRTRIRKDKASLVKNENEMNYYNTVEQALQTNMAATAIQEKELSFASRTIDELNPVERLDFFDTNTGSGIDKPFILDGIRYANEAEYWNQQKTNYLNSGKFFKDTEDFYKAKIATDYVKNQDTYLLKIKQYGDAMKALFTRDDIATYQKQFAQTFANIMGEVSTLEGSRIMKDYDASLDDTSTVTRLNALQDLTGIDQKDNYNALVAKIAETKSDVFNMVMQRADELVKNGLSQDEAVRQAMATARFFNPKQFAEKSTQEIIDVATGKKTTPEITKTTTDLMKGGIEGKKPIAELDKSLLDVLQKRPDLRELYDPITGQAKNPNDVRVAGIPTITDWAKTHGYKEEATLKQFMPSKSDTPSPEPVKPGTPSVLPKQTSVAQYIVKAGDNLSKIGKLYGLSGQQLFEANKDTLNDPNIIKPNQVIKIPKL